MAVIQKNELLRIETFDRVAGLIPHIYRNRYQSRFRSEPSVLREQRRSHKEYHYESHRSLCGQSRCHNADEITVVSVMKARRIHRLGT